nr:PIN domain-containing protein [Corynebacterium mastitidis]
MARCSALLDSCVLVPMSQADTLLRIAQAGLYRPLWSTIILEETVRALERIHPDMRRTGAGRHRVTTMNRYFQGSCVHRWDHLVPIISLPDEDDRHVVAAAIQGRADLIVTANLKDFPSAELQRFSLTTQHPDEFLLNQLDVNPRLVMGALAHQAAATAHPRVTVNYILNDLSRCGARGFARAARSQLWRLASR